MIRATKMLILGLAVIAGLSACKKDWDSHNAITDEQINLNLFERIQANSNLSKFAELLVKSGYDKVLASSKNFTVFAPTNDALAGLDPAIVNDTAKLNPFVANHIANQSYYTSRVTDTARIPLLNYKYHNMLGKKVESANITEADLLAKNGVLQVIDKMLPVLANLWEAMFTHADFPTQQATYLSTLGYQGFDPALAEQIGVDPLTGNPVYRPGTGVVARNRFWDGVYDIRNEEMQYTYFAIADAGFNLEKTALKPYYLVDSTLSADSVISFAIVKDLVFEGKRELTALPDTLVSKSGVKVGIDQSKIFKTIQSSNGIIYVMSSLNVLPGTKFISRIIQAENYLSTSHDRRNNTTFRDRINPLTGLSFRDVRVSGHGVALFNMRYQLTDMPSIRYKAYWVAVNDFQTANFNQKLGIGTAISTVLPYVAVTSLNYNEVLLGEFTLDVFRPTLNIFLTAANSTAAAVNPVVCDYIRLEPVF